MNNLLMVNNLNISYKIKDEKVQVIKNLNFEVNNNEFVTILGPSGCGKSTLLKILGGFIKPDSGEVLINHNPITGSSVDRIMVFQEFQQLFPWKTIIENVVFALKAKDLYDNERKRREVAKTYLKEVDLEDYLSYYPHQLSGGMKQRAALARALVTNPEILLMDEPFGSLDSQTREELQNLLTKIWQKEANTIIFVTHDIREAIILSDRIFIMTKKSGSIKKIIDNNLDRPRSEGDENFIDLYQMIKTII